MLPDRRERAAPATTQLPSPPLPPDLHSVTLPPPPLSVCSRRDPKKNPDGWIPLVVAENKLGNAAVLERLTEVQGYPTAVLNYSGWVRPAAPPVVCCCCCHLLFVVAV